MQTHTLKSLIQDAKADVMEIMEAKLELLQLKMAEKGATAAAGGLYGLILFSVINLIITFLLISGAFAFSLLFIQNPESLTVLRALLFGFLCIAGGLIIVLLLVLLIKNTLQEQVKSKVINQVLDQMEEQERTREANRLKQTYLEESATHFSNGIVGDQEISNQINE